MMTTRCCRTSFDFGHHFVLAACQEYSLQSSSKMLQSRSAYFVTFRAFTGDPYERNDATDSYNIKLILALKLEFLKKSSVAHIIEYVE